MLGRFEKSQVTDQIQLLVIIWTSRHRNNYLNDIPMQMICKGLFIADKKIYSSLSGEGNRVELRFYNTPFSIVRMV